VKSGELFPISGVSFQTAVENSSEEVKMRALRSTDTEPHSARQQTASAVTLNADTGEELDIDILPYDPAQPEPRMLARDLHRKLESGRQYANWFKQRCEEADLVVGEEFGIFHKLMENSGRGRPRLDHWVTLDAAKEISMLEQTAIGKKVRRHLIAAEKRLRRMLQGAPEPAFNLSDPQSLLQLVNATSTKLLEVTREKEVLLLENKAVAEHIEVVTTEKAKVESDLETASDTIRMVAEQRDREERAELLSVWLETRKPILGYGLINGRRLLYCLGYGRKVVYFGSVQESRETTPMGISFTHIPDLELEQD
jgi:phage anti-repressor protein